jgi:methanethiol S-methyltransferase
MLLLITTLLLFAIVHSVLAATSVKSFFEQKMTAQTYRLVYNLQSALFVVAILYMIVNGKKDLIFEQNIGTNILGAILVIAGLYIMKSTFQGLDVAAFIGLKNPKIESSGGLSTGGMYAIVRHPLYWGTTKAWLGLFVLLPYASILVTLLIGMLYIAIGIEFEEKKLRRDFGDTYDAYALGKKKFIPFVY